eukprot:gene14180-biopygen4017
MKRWGAQARGGVAGTGAGVPSSGLECQAPALECRAPRWSAKRPRWSAKGRALLARNDGLGIPCEGAPEGPSAGVPSSGLECQAAALECPAPGWSAKHPRWSAKLGRRSAEAGRRSAAGKGALPLRGALLDRPERKSKKIFMCGGGGHARAAMGREPSEENGWGTERDDLAKTRRKRTSTPDHFLKESLNGHGPEPSEVLEANPATVKRTWWGTWWETTGLSHGCARGGAGPKPRMMEMIVASAPSAAATSAAAPAAPPQ